MSILKAGPSTHKPDVAKLSLLIDTEKNFIFTYCVEIKAQSTRHLEPAIAFVTRHACSPKQVPCPRQVGSRVSRMSGEDLRAPE